jgi:dihydroneopterin aldolase
MGHILVEGIRCFAYHGCMDEEGVIGTDFTVDVEVEADLTVSAKSDELVDTVDYVTISRIVQEQMAIKSKLIEHVGHRIITQIMDDIPLVAEVKVKLTKHNAPIQGHVRQVAVVMTTNREEIAT